MSADPTSSSPDAGGQPSEEELRAAYERELSRITTADLALQAAVSLLNLGGRRLGLATSAGQPPESERDLEQVRDAIDAVRALLEILERRQPQELGPLRDALSQLQMAYAREAAAQPQEAPSEGSAPSADGGGRGAGAPAKPAGPGEQDAEETQRGPGPAQSSGRLWVPGQ